MLVPLTLLGSKVELLTHSAGNAYTSGQYTVVRCVPSHGGQPLRTLVLDETDFSADAMEAANGVPFEAMKLPQLKEELAGRGVRRRSGLKAVLQRRLHGLLVGAAMARRAEEAAENGDVDSMSEGGDDDAVFWEAVDEAATSAEAKDREAACAARREAARTARLYELFGTDSEDEQ